MMTLKEAIKHCKDVALSCTNKECALEHFQLLNWLQEYSNMLEKQGEKNPIMNVPTRDSTDAFIEQTCEWLRSYSHNYANNALGKEHLINDYRNYMKGE